MKFEYGAMEGIPGFVLASGDRIARCETGAATFAVGQQRSAQILDGSQL